MNQQRLNKIKEEIENIDWHSDFEKACVENYKILDSLCDEIRTILNTNPQSADVNNALLLLAENVGCAEDFERYEENFVEVLFDSNLISKEQLQLFYENANGRQG